VGETMKMRKGAGPSDVVLEILKSAGEDGIFKFLS